MTKLLRNALNTLLLRYSVTSLLCYFVTPIEDVVYPRANGCRRN